MSRGENKPWDARLVEWMSRGSGEAGRGSMPSWQRKLYAAIWISYIVVDLTTGRWPWWLLAVYLAIAVVALCGSLILKRRRSG